MDTFLRLFPLLWAQTADKNCCFCGETTEPNGDPDPYSVGFHMVDSDSDPHFEVYHINGKTLFVAVNGYEVYHLSCRNR